MKKTKVMELARKLAAFQERARLNGMMNMPNTTEERVEQMAQESLLQKQIHSAQMSYDSAFREWENDGFPD